MEGDRVCHWDERGLKEGRPGTTGQGSQPHLCAAPGPHTPLSRPQPSRPSPISPTHPARVQLRTSLASSQAPHCRHLSPEHGGCCCDLGWAGWSLSAALTPPFACSHAFRLWRALGAEQPVSHLVLAVLLGWLQKRPLPTRTSGSSPQPKKAYLRSLAVSLCPTTPGAIPAAFSSVFSHTWV